jgi:DNA-binding PadR family transcriptional regulator
MHGYELRKRLDSMLGLLRRFSYGSLYPCLRTLAERGWISSCSAGDDLSHGLSASKRARIVYQLTEQGAAALEGMLGEAGPASWEDDYFDVRFALFAQTDPETRLRILEGRRARMTERLDALSTAIRRSDNTDPYTKELQDHGLDQLEREIRWLDRLIDSERTARRAARRTQTTWAGGGAGGAPGIAGGVLGGAASEGVVGAPPPGSGTPYTSSA